MGRKKLLADALKVVAVTLLLFAFVELIIRVAFIVRNSFVTQVPLPYVVGHNYGPVPPWLDDLRILETDEALLWRNRPNLVRKYIDIFSPIGNEESRAAILRDFLPTTHASFKDNPVWEISLNSDGFRDVEFPKEKPTSGIRVICLGDSWTFGTNVGQRQAYPQRLRALLMREFPERNFEVFNLGVLGYSSYQGLEVLKRKIVDLDPDIVVIAFAMNDASLAGWRDKDISKSEKKDSVIQKITRISKNLYLLKLSRYWIKLYNWNPPSFGDHLKAKKTAASNSEEALNYEKLEPYLRVSPRDYRNNIQQMINLAQSRNAGVILIYNQLSRDMGEVAGVGWVGKPSPYVSVLEEIAQKEKIPLLDSSAFITEAKKEIEQDLERQLNLVPSRNKEMETYDQTAITFRVFLENRPVPRGMYIVGTHSKLGGVVPNKIAMYDDGTHGDQIAGDGVWSYTQKFSPGTTLFYVYTNSGELGKWNGLDLPFVRSLTVKPNHGFNPIETFGKVYMQADSWHTNAYGYELIAQSLLKVLSNHEKVLDLLAKREGERDQA